MDNPFILIHDNFGKPYYVNVCNIAYIDKTDDGVHAWITINSGHEYHGVVRCRENFEEVRQLIDKVFCNIQEESS